jgi:2-polyprenyl-3-methyl-5-hydroxy-6-metoxy-1,4-benzoquinol methylase
MNLHDLIRRDAHPAPWSEGDNIPWHEAAFSQRMLREHLSQAHDAASRRMEKIAAHVAWIHHEVLGEEPSRVLDLGCGPGLYSARLAALGHTCVGIDYGPAAIAYANEAAAREGLDCRYILGDLRQVEYGAGFDLVMQIYGELNVFRPDDARTILTKGHAALKPGGTVLLEAHTREVVRRIGAEGRRWSSSSGGLFSAEPHLTLEESLWDEATQTATTRYYIVDADSGAVTRYAQSFQAYTEAGYRDLLARCGLCAVMVHPSLLGIADASEPDFIVLQARR